MSFLNTLHAAALIPEAAYMKFLTRYKFNNQKIHVFYEGLEDASFYNSYLKFYITDRSHEEYICDGKGNLLQIYNDINWNRYNKNRVLFFVDKDLDDYFKTVVSDINVFLTKYYSVENYLVSEEMLGIFLKDICKIRDTTTIDHIVHDFGEKLSVFHSHMLILTAWIIYCRGNNFALNLNEIKLSNFIKLDNEFCPVKTKPIGYQSLYHYLCKISRTNHPLNWKEILSIARSINQDHKLFIRGKYELWFMFVYCSKVVKEILPILNKKISQWNKNNPTTITKCKIFSLTEENIFEVFASRIPIPDELKDFIEVNLAKVTS